MEEDKSDKEESDTKVEHIKVTVKTQKDSQTLEAPSDCLISNFKEIIAPKFNASPENLLLIFAGKVMKDHMTLKQHNVQDGFTIHLVVKGARPAQGAVPQNNEPRAENRFGSTNQSPFVGASSLGGPNSPILSHVLMDENTVRLLLTQLPQIQAIVESNPEINQLLNNPDLIRQSINMATNPSLMQEVMRQQDRALSNIESLPGGSQILEQMFRNVQEPMMTAMDETLRPNMFASSGHNTPTTPTSQQGTENREALPNPWNIGEAGRNTPEGGVMNVPGNLEAPASGQNQSAQPMFTNLIQQIIRGLDYDQTGQNNNINPDPNFAQTDRLTSLLSRMRETTQQNDAMLEERYRNELDQLNAMGFENRQANLRALSLTFGDVNAAVDRLLNHNL